MVPIWPTLPIRTGSYWYNNASLDILTYPKIIYKRVRGEDHQKMFDTRGSSGVLKIIDTRNRLR